MLVTIMVLIGFVIPVHADVGIDISQKCKLLIKNNLDSSCPSIEQILSLFPDTSPKHLVGDFEVIDGILQRAPPQYDIKNMNTFYRSIGDDDRVWIDPPAGLRNNLQMITIESNFKEYPISASYSMSNNTLSVGTQRHVNFGCTTAIIDADDWFFLTGDTIVHLQKGCTPESTNFDHIKKYYFEKSFQDISTSYKYKLEKWIESSREKCRELCFEY